MSWHLLEKSLDEVSKQSTVFGKLWITFLFVFRVIAVTRMGDTVYADEQAAFRCNIKQIGCENVCFNEFSPISHVRFWGFQIIIVATPAMMFLVYTTHAVSWIPSAKLVKRKLEFFRGKKQTKSRISKNTSKTTQSTCKNSTPAASQRSLKKLNNASAWNKQKHDMVSKWKTSPDPAPLLEIHSFRRLSDSWKKSAHDKGSPPAYQEKNHCYYEHILLKNVPSIQQQNEDDYDNGRWRGQPSGGSDTPKSFPRRNKLYKEVSLNRIRRHSDGDLNKYQHTNYLTKHLDLTNSEELQPIRLSRVSHSPPHYSVIQLSQLADISSWNRLFPIKFDDVTEKNCLYADVPSTKSCSTVKRKNVSKATSILTPHTPQARTPQAHSILVNHSPNAIIWREKTGESTFRDGNKSVTNRSIATKRSKCTSAQTKRNRSRIASVPQSEGYVEFAKRIDNIERRIAIAYFSQCVLRLILESCFLYLQYRIFDFNVPELYKCRRWPCPNTVDCYISRPNEKSYMLYFMFSLTAFCIFLAFCEIVSLTLRQCKECCQARATFEETEDESILEDDETKQNKRIRSHKKCDFSKHPYLLEGYAKMMKGVSIEEDQETTTSSDTKSTKSSKSETETDDLQANTFNSQDLESMFDNDLAADEINNEENEAAEMYV